MFSEQISCSLLLELPDKGMESRFWESEGTVSAYSNWEFYTALNRICANLIMARTLSKALLDVTALKYTWHMHANILINILSCATMLILIKRYSSFYRRTRHHIVVGQRLLQLLFMALAAYQSSEGLQAANARALNVHAAGSRLTLRTAVANLTRPLFVGPLVIMSHASWVFRTKTWLPLQVLTFFIAVLGSVRHQYCRMAADPSSALLLQSTCRAVPEVHQFILGATFGTLFPALNSGPDLPACSTMALAARTLSWYAHFIYGVLLPVAGFCTLEWRLKSRWVKKNLGMDLVYGPLGWPRSQHEHRTFAVRLQSFLSWMLVLMGAFVLAWAAAAWVVPRLPLMQCRTCVDADTCRKLDCEGEICGIPGHWTAAMLHLQMVCMLLLHITVTHLAC